MTLRPQVSPPCQLPKPTRFPNSLHTSSHGRQTRHWWNSFSLHTPGPHKDHRRSQICPKLGSQHTRRSSAAPLHAHTFWLVASLCYAPSGYMYIYILDYAPILLNTPVPLLLSSAPTAFTHLELAVRPPSHSNLDRPLERIRMFTERRVHDRGCA